MTRWRCFPQLSRNLLSDFVTLVSERITNGSSSAVATRNMWPILRKAVLIRLVITFDILAREESTQYAVSFAA